MRLPYSTPEDHLKEALRLARKGRYTSAPNPRVGAIVVRDGRVVGRGWHQAAGGPHAEIAAFSATDGPLEGSELYVTLEPCSHSGRTPPCTEAVLAAGIRRVFACHRDPNPKVAGRGFAKLREGGVEVHDGFLVEDALSLNLGFVTLHALGRPAVSLKWAMSLDGKIATRTGHSQWISSASARRWALRLREEHDAILVGVGTILADDPRLDRRLEMASGPNLRIVLDRRLRTPLTAATLDLPGDVLVYTESQDVAVRRALTERGATVVGLPEVSPESVLEDLATREVQSVLVEGGGEIHGSFFSAGLFDRVEVDCAPILVGGGEAPGPIRGEGADTLAEALRLEAVVTERRGGDLVISGLREGCLRELSASVAGS